jgi:UPF0271 protein
MAPRRTIDLNADVGEAADAVGIEVERTLLGLVTSAHVACGGHAGDRDTMAATVTAAREHGVRVGAHPSYPDRAGFGRHPMALDGADLTASLREQLQTLAEVGRSAGVPVESVKAHGALYGEVAKGGAAYAAFVSAVGAVFEPGVTLVLRAGCPAVALARRAGWGVLEEGFCDRAYTAGGELVDRAVAGAVLSDLTAVAHQATTLACHGTVQSIDGTSVSVRIDTLCIHGDTPDAVPMANAVRWAMDGSGIDIAAPPVRP